MENIPFGEFFVAAAEKHWQDQMTENPLFYLWFVAQCKAESDFDPRAVSGAGACGLMQIMPLTWREIRLYLTHLSKNIFDPKSNIEAGIWYDRFCYDRFYSIPESADRLLIAFAAYNCGPTRIKKILAANACNTYNELEGLIPYKETRDYVGRIVRFRENL